MDTYYREKELKGRIKTFELQIAKHQRRIEVSKDKLTTCENELKEIQEEEESLKNLERKKIVTGGLPYPGLEDGEVQADGA